MKTLSQCTILVVDDTEANVDILVETLGEIYEVSVAMDGFSALEVVDTAPPDLILLDIMMPGMDGYDVCRKLKADPKTRDIPIIFLTALDEIASKTRGFSLGAVDYITKPFEILEVQARVKTHLSLLLARRELASQNEILEARVKERTRELYLTQQVTFESLAALAEYRDPETGGHIKRTQHYVKVLAEALLDHPKYRHEVTPLFVEQLFSSAPLHDIGKVGIADNILLKEGKLTDEEFERMKMHTIFGRDALLAAERKLGGNSFLRLAWEVAYSHQEKWDGSGYPQGLKGEAIPLSGRIMAIADVYDALISKRVYKPPMPHRSAVLYIIAGSGTHFDPDLVAVFETLTDVFLEIALRYADHEEERIVLVS